MTGAVALPRPKDSLRRLSASSVVRISPYPSSSPKCGRGEAGALALDPSQLWAPADSGAAEASACNGMATPTAAAAAQPRANGALACNGSPGESPPPLLELLRSSLPPADSPSKSSDEGGAGDGTDSPAARRQQTVEMLLALNGRGPTENGDASHHSAGTNGAGAAGKKRGSRRSFFSRGGGSSKAEAAAAAAAADENASANGSTHSGGTADGPLPAVPRSPGGSSSAGSAGSAGAAGAAAADTEPSPKKDKDKKSSGGWFSSFFSGGSRGASKQEEVPAAAAAGQAGPSSQDPIMGGLPLLSLGGPEQEGGNSSPGREAGSSNPLKQVPSPAINGLLPAADLPAEDGSAGGGSGGRRGNHKRHRSLTQMLQQGLGIKALRSRRHHSGGSVDEVLGEPSTPLDFESSNGSKGSGSSPHVESLGPAAPKPPGGSPALACFGLGVRQATVGDDDEACVASPQAANGLALAPELSLEVVEGPVLPLTALGIRNIGNSCFLNAALQCLRHTPYLPLLLAPDLLDGQQQGQQQQSAAAEPVAPLPAAHQQAIGDAAPLAADTEQQQQQQQQQPVAADGEVPWDSAAAAASGQQDAHTAQVAEGSGSEPVAASAGAGEQPGSAAAPENEGGAAGAANDAAVAGPEAPAQDPGGAATGDAPAAAGAEGNTAAAAEPQQPEAAAAEPAATAAAEGGTQQPAAAVTAAPAAVVARPQRPPRGELLRCFAGVLRDLCRTDGGLSAVDPYALLQLLRRFPTAADYFDGGQHDCQEVLRVLMDLLHDELNRVPQPAPPLPPEAPPHPAESESSKADRFWARYLARDSSPITDLFSGQLQSSVTCHGCSKRFTMYEPFWDLSLPLAKEGKSSSLGWLGIKGTPASIQDCLRVFTADEKLEGEEAFHCEVCKDKTPAIKHLRIHRFPDVLVLHIKRFKYKGSNTDKLTANVSFPLKELCLADFASPECPVPPPDCTYDLFAVSNHFGTLGGGHYTAMCRAPLAGGKEAWYSYNDEVVTQVPATQTVSQHAYILFYRRRKYKPRAEGAGPAAAPPAAAAAAAANGGSSPGHRRQPSTA